MATVGSTLRLSTTPFTGTLPISYQWQVDPGTGTPVNVPGQTNTTLVLTGVKMSDAGSYTLVASNSQGSASTITPAYVTIYAQPAAPFVVNYQWYSTVTSGGDLNDVGLYSGPGLPGFESGTFWNQIQGPQNGNGAGTYSSLSGIASDGATDTHVGASVTCSESWDWTSTPTIPLLDCAVTARAATPATFSFIVPNGMYNLALFCCNGTEAPTANGGTIFTINGVSKTSHPTTDTSFVVENDNYVVFHNLVVTDGLLNGVCAADPSKSYGSLNGAQLQYVGPAVVLNAQPQAGGQLKLEWSQGVLLEAPSITGPCDHQFGAFAVHGDADGRPEILPNPGPVIGSRQFVCRTPVRVLRRAEKERRSIPRRPRFPGTAWEVRGSMFEVERSRSSFALRFQRFP